ncbi:YaiI/YqxD family protein [Pseudoalteromonas piratica]|uniref:UPF0178 protein OM33_19640 n=1 Tax=Pseudoalteromonas piratica TaxID=1348114 RepID=A0A0A7EKP4_9GAMM|nr:YaiI/YqxD family protein [Pseudoalteromonas piratica]AIY67265.1 hypothetical protein OM33_19640 [Pseudoalteromonas piratica]
MNIWVDADACPVVIKEILFRAAERTQIMTTFIANHSFRIPPSQFIKRLQVEKGFDVADNVIAQRVAPGDLVITQDIPLADEVITKQAIALTPRGELLTASNIKSRLNMRDFFDTLRASGVETGGPSALSNADKKAFADELDKALAKAR